MFKGFPRTTFLSAALFGIASAGGSMGSCAMTHWDDDKRTYQARQEPARFCYQTLGEISCYAAPQAQMGPIVALEPEKIVEPNPDAIDPEVSTKAEPSPATPAVMKASEKPIPLAPASSKPVPLAPGHDAPLNPPKKGFPSEPASLSPNYPQPRAGTPAAAGK